MSVSLYRRYRPRTFDEVAGQETVVDVLKKALQRERVAHAWLFSGPRGCGKTTAARLLAKALNCTRLKDGYEPCGECEHCRSISAGESLDVVEIDGASNNGVEEIRELKTHVSLSPFSSRWKIYIIDEVHMLSISAFNALLKTLEEPPPFVVFILATTEPHKVPVTIRSRCQHIPFSRIGMSAICARLELVAGREGVPFDPKAVREIARHADGALRDALSLMEQAISLGNGEVSMDAADRLLGGGTLTDLEKWVSSLKDTGVHPFLLLEEMFQKGASPQRVTEGIFLLFRNLWAVKRWGKPALEALALSENEMEYLCAEESRWTEAQLSEMMLFCSRMIPQVRTGLRSDVLSGLLAAKGTECGDSLRPAETSSVRTAPPHPSPVQPAPQIERKKPSPPEAEKSGSAPPPLPDAPLSGEETVPFEGGPSQEAWREVEKRLFKKNLPLYCMLAGTSIDVEERQLEIRFPEDAGYCFTVLSSERNSHALFSEASKILGEGLEIRLAWKNERRQCSGDGNLQEEPKDLNGWSEPASPPLLFRPPEGIRKENGRPSAPDTGGENAPAAPRENGAGGETLPFEGLVNEVLKWSEGEIILVRKESNESEGGEDIPAPGEL